MSEHQAEAGPTTYYLLVCLDCGEGEHALAMPFDTAQARGAWAAVHTSGTGHDRWFVKNVTHLPDRRG